jgi:sugar-specific transcriptional regulator TrmB
MNTQDLVDLGLTSNESQVYVELLKLGESKSGEIVKKTSLHRVQIYDALESLKQKGLTSYVIKENIKYFKAENPKQLSIFLEEKQNNAKNIILELEKIQSKEQKKQSVSVYEGIKGLKAAMNNMLEELKIGDEHRVFASGEMANAMGSFYTQFQNKKKKKNIKTKIIYDSNFKKEVTILEKTFGTFKFTPISPFPTDTWIYNNKVLIVTYSADPPIAILIQSQETANSYKKIFEGYWKK